MAGRIQIDPERISCRLSWLRRMLRRTERQQFGLDGVNVVHGQVEVKLLRPLTSRPSRRCVLVGQLERKAQSVDSQDDPVVDVGAIDFSAQDTPVELSESPGMRAVENHRAHAGE